MPCLQPRSGLARPRRKNPAEHLRVTSHPVAPRQLRLRARVGNPFSGRVKKLRGAWSALPWPSSRMSVPCSTKFSGSSLNTRRSSSSRAILRGACPAADACWSLAAGALVAVALLTYRSTGMPGEERPPQGPHRADGAENRHDPGADFLPVPPDADSQGGRAAAEFPRRPRRRLAEHDDRRHATASRAARSCSSSSPARTPLLNALSQRFVLRFFRFSSPGRPRARRSAT